MMSWILLPALLSAAVGPAKADGDWLANFLAEGWPVPSSHTPWNIPFKRQLDHFPGGAPYLLYGPGGGNRLRVYDPDLSPRNTLIPANADMQYTAQCGTTSTTYSSIFRMDIEYATCALETTQGYNPLEVSRGFFAHIRSTGAKPLRGLRVTGDYVARAAAIRTEAFSSGVWRGFLKVVHVPCPYNCADIAPRYEANNLLHLQLVVLNGNYAQWAQRTDRDSTTGRVDFHRIVNMTAPSATDIFYAMWATTTDVANPEGNNWWDETRRAEVQAVFDRIVATSPAPPVPEKVAPPAYMTVRACAGDYEEKCVDATAHVALRCCKDPDARRSRAFSICDETTYDDAETRCRDRGGRICPYEEVSSSCRAGCRFDWERIWTTKPCTVQSP